MLEICLWVVSEPDIRIPPPCRFVGVCGKGAGWEFLIAMRVDEGGGGGMGKGVRRRRDGKVVI